MKPILPVLCSSAALVVVGSNVADLRETVSPPGRPPGLEMHETHASASLLGQFRTSASSWLWVRTDLYLHNGVEMRPLSEAELHAGHKGVGSSDNEDKALHDDELHVTVIPPKERDFRGLFGDVERATRAYKDMRNHGHNDPVTALPLFRLMTWIDPQFIPGWTTGAAVLARDRSDRGLAKALEILEEGRAKNPASIALNSEIGYLLAARRRDFDGAIMSLEHARRLGSGDLGRLSEDDREALPTAYRWLALIYRERGRLDKMYAILREGRHRFPDDAVIERLLEMPPSPLWKPNEPEKVPADAIRADEDDHHGHDHEHENCSEHGHAH